MNQTEIWLKKGISFLDLANYSQARQYFDKIIEIDNSNVLANYHKAISYVRESNDSSAKEFFLEVLKHDLKNGLTYIHLGNIERKNQEYENAINYYRKAILYYNDEHMDLLYFNFGKSILDYLDFLIDYNSDEEIDKLKLNEEALNAFIKVIDINPTNDKVIYEVASLYFYEFSNYQKAKKYFVQLLEILNENNKQISLKKMVYPCLIICESYLGNFDQSIDYIKQGLQINSNLIKILKRDSIFKSILKTNDSFNSKIENLS
ncbi:tetratricopeptide repeat protein [Aureivirga sp. CE67]|uniref:tetratricopeptide repeat protein n=1 Tax=Aureivirga sp. CE67 TaxID=1788983 RepID=UPI0018CB6F50|nr:hypothetical protein [Aureivirga sp. CE67]